MLFRSANAEENQAANAEENEAANAEENEVEEENAANEIAMPTARYVCNLPFFMHFFPSLCGL